MVDTHAANTELQRTYLARMDDLTRFKKRFAGEADNVSRWAKTSTVLVIVLGAISALKNAVEPSLSDPSFKTVLAVLFAVIGAAIATVASLKAFFKWEENEGRLRELHDRCYQLMVEFQTRKAEAQDEPTLRALMDDLNKKLMQVNSDALRFGINPGAKDK